MAPQCSERFCSKVSTGLVPQHSQWSSKSGKIQNVGDLELSEGEFWCFNGENFRFQVQIYIAASFAFFFVPSFILLSNNHPTINTYVEGLKKDIKQSKTVTPRKIRLNLSKDENVALKHLSKRDDIVIANADWGGAVVIMDVNDYDREAKRQLNDSIHKEGNPGCPVVSSINFHTANISKYMDYHLQPTVKQIPFYEKASATLSKKLTQ